MPELSSQKHLFAKPLVYTIFGMVPGILLRRKFPRKPALHRGKWAPRYFWGTSNNRAISHWAETAFGANKEWEKPRDKLIIHQKR